MSWQDRDYAGDEGPGLGRPGGDWQGMRPTFDNPFTWSVFLGRISGIAVRIHVVFLIYIVIALLRSLSQYGDGPMFGIMALTMGLLFVIVLAHEFGHCLACRWVGGQADEILMWPLGGLAFTQPGHRWQAHLITAVGGPLVNVVLCLVAGVMLGALTGTWLGVAIPNVVNPFGAQFQQIAGSWPLLTLYLVNMLSFVLLLFNLLPLFPLDGGRILQSALWPKYGYSRSMRIAVRAGYIGGILLAIYGAVMSQWAIVAIALFGIYTCYMTNRQLQWTDSMLGYESDEYALSVHYGGKEEEHEEPAPRKPTWWQRQAQRRAQQEEREAQEVDRILQKIADSGMESLSRSERNLLKRVTDRKRQGR